VLTAINPEALRTRRERSLSQELAAESDVAFALKKLEERHGGYGFMGRRSLLTGALRLTRTMAPSKCTSMRTQTSRHRPCAVRAAPM
jgi:hypothetical protein